MSSKQSSVSGWSTVERSARTERLGCVSVAHLAVMPSSKRLSSCRCRASHLSAECWPGTTMRLAGGSGFVLVRVLFVCQLWAEGCAHAARSEFWRVCLAGRMPLSTGVCGVLCESRLPVAATWCRVRCSHQVSAVVSLRVLRVKEHLCMSGCRNGVCSVPRPGMGAAFLSAGFSGVWLSHTCGFGAHSGCCCASVDHVEFFVAF